MKSFAGLTFLFALLAASLGSTAAVLIASPLPPRQITHEPWQQITHEPWQQPAYAASPSLCRAYALWEAAAHDRVARMFVLCNDPTISKDTQ